MAAGFRQHRPRSLSAAIRPPGCGGSGGDTSGRSTLGEWVKLIGAVDVSRRKASELLDELTKRNVRLSLGGPIHDSIDPGGAVVQRVGDCRGVRSEARSWIIALADDLEEHPP